MGSRLAVNVKYVSNIADVKIYHRKSGIFYEPDRAAAQSLNPWCFFQKINGWHSEVPAHHSYTQCLLWSADSSAMLLKLSGAWDARDDVPGGRADRLVFCIQL